VPGLLAPRFGRLGDLAWGPPPEGSPSCEAVNLASGVQESFSRWPNAMSEAERYTLVVRARSSRHHPRPWGWEIFRDGKPLPARLRKDGYRTEYTTTAAGKVALASFLAGRKQVLSIGPAPLELRCSVRWHDACILFRLVEKRVAGLRRKD
jgi:hypothetical protein